MFKARLISDRQDLVEYTPEILSGIRGVQRVRLDMFWIETIYGSLLVEPYPGGRFIVELNGCSVPETMAPPLKDLATEWFRLQPEYIQQCIWWDNLQPYFEACNRATERCPICRGMFVHLGRHYHRAFREKIYCYNPGMVLASEQEIFKPGELEQI